MMNKAGSFAAFIFGAAIGSVVTWQLTKRKYEHILQEEIDSVKAVFSKRVSNDISNEDELYDRRTPEHEETFENYKNLVGAYSEEKEEAAVDRPYVISPDEFSNQYDYNTISLTYYADGVLADEDDEVVDDVDDVIGLKSLTHFGEYEDDSVFVRNDARKCDYEILLDQRNYADVIKNKPHHTEE